MDDDPVFPTVAWFQALARLLNSDAAFRQLSRWTSARVGFSVDGHPTIVTTLIDGSVVAVEESEGIRGVDYRIEGPPEGWELLFTERGSLARATNQRYGKLRVRGNLVLAAGDNWTLANICRRFREVNGQGDQA